MSWTAKALREHLQRDHNAWYGYQALKLHMEGDHLRFHQEGRVKPHSHTRDEVPKSFALGLEDRAEDLMRQALIAKGEMTDGA